MVKCCILNGRKCCIFIDRLHPRRLILKKLWDHTQKNNNTMPFYYWGDMDLGGFRIWNHLCEKTGIPIKPLFMDEKTYLTHINQGLPMDENYMKKLNELLVIPAYEPFHSLIAMLKMGIRIEQEAVQIKDYDEK